MKFNGMWHNVCDYYFETKQTLLPGTTWEYTVYREPNEYDSSLTGMWQWDGEIYDDEYYHFSSRKVQL